MLFSLLPAPRIQQMTETHSVLRRLGM